MAAWKDEQCSALSRRRGLPVLVSVTSRAQVSCGGHCTLAVCCHDGERERARESPRAGRGRVSAWMAHAALKPQRGPPVRPTPNPTTPRWTPVPPGGTRAYHILGHSPLAGSKRWASVSMPRGEGEFQTLISG